LKKKWNQFTAKGLLSLSSSLALASQSEAAVTVFFEQDGTNVTASWVGTLHPGLFIADVSGFNSDGTADPNGFINLNGDSYDVYGNGSPSTTTLGSTENFSLFDATRTYGFAGDAFFISAPSDGVRNFTGSSPILFSAEDDVFVIPGVTLAELGADNFNNTLAWTSSAGDTVSYTTIPIPEPSSAFLLIGAGLGGLFQRRRK